MAPGRVELPGGAPGGVPGGVPGQKGPDSASARQCASLANMSFLKKIWPGKSDDDKHEGSSASEGAEAAATAAKATAEARAQAGEASDADSSMPDGSEPKGVIAKSFFTAVNKAAAVQGPIIDQYLRSVLGRDENASTSEKQARLDKHFKALATGSGIGTGGLAAVPGIGTIASLATATGESVMLLEACGFYALASAKLNGIDISDEQRRRAIVMLAVSGASDADLVKALTEKNAVAGVRSIRSLTKAGGRDMLQVNNIIGRIALKQVRKRFGGALLGKLMPFGVGVVLGARANRKMADQMIEQVHNFLRYEGISV